MSIDEELSRRRLPRAPAKRIEMGPGDEVLFMAERLPYTVRAVSADGRWVICTRPFDEGDREEFEDLIGIMEPNVIYTVIDFDTGRRGPDNCLGLGYEDDEQVARAMARFEAGTAELTMRYDVLLDIAAVQRRPS